jgi:hypothetical protein
MGQGAGQGYAFAADPVRRLPRSKPLTGVDTAYRAECHYRRLRMSGMWVIGLFVAIELIFNRWAYLFVALAARRAGQFAR